MSNRAIIERELTQGVVPIGTPKAYQYDAALVESAVAAVVQGLAELGEYTEEKKSEYLNYATTILQAIQNQYGYPFVASTVSEMTDTTKIYVYTGSESGYTAGDWYYYNGSAWVSGGEFNSDSAPIKAEMSLFGIDDLLWDNTSPVSKSAGGVTGTVDSINKTITVSSSGSASSAIFLINFALSSDPFPAWLQKQKKYIVHMETSSNIRFEIYQKRTGDASGVLLTYVDKRSPFVEFEFASDAIGVGIRLWLARGETINEVLRPFISEAFTLQEIEQQVSELGRQTVLNILNKNYFVNSSGFVWNADKTTCMMTGIASESARYNALYFSTKPGFYPLEVGRTYTIDYDSTDEHMYIVVYGYNNGSYAGTIMTHKGSFVWDGSYDEVRILVNYDANATPNNSTVSNISVIAQTKNSTKLNGLEKHVGTNPVVLNTGYIDNTNDNKWYTGSGTHAIYPVRGGEVVEILANAERNSSLAALKSYNYESGVVADFSDDPNWQKVIVLTPKKLINAVLPNDANYVYFYYSYGGTSRYPQSLKINGYDIMKSITDNLTDFYENSRNENLILGDILNSGYIDDNTDKWIVTQSYYKHAIYPVQGGEYVEFVANADNYSSLAALKSYSIPANGDDVDYSDDENWNTVKVFSPNAKFSGYLPSDAKFIYCYYKNGSQLRYPQILKLDGYDITKTIRGNVGEVHDAVVNLEQKIRIMQYNVGRFNYGNTQSEGLPAEIYDDKLLELKKLFTSVEPDIVGMEEYLEYLDHAETHKSDDVLFDYLFPFKDNNYQYKRAIKSKYPVTHVTLKWFSTVIDETTKRLGLLHARVNVNGKIIDVLTGAFPSAPSLADYQARAILFPMALNYCANMEYPFLVVDLNNGGNGSDVSASDEANELIAVAQTAGWNSINGGFLPLQKTYFDPVHRPDLFSPIDHIFYKNNGKVIFNNFVVCHEDYEVLPSDHDPVYGDFVLL